MYILGEIIGWLFVLAICAYTFRDSYFKKKG